MLASFLFFIHKEFIFGFRVHWFFLIHVVDKSDEYILNIRTSNVTRESLKFNWIKLDQKYTQWEVSAPKLAGKLTVINGCKDFLSFQNSLPNDADGAL